MICCIPVSAFTLCKDVEEDGGKGGGGIGEEVMGQDQGQGPEPYKGRNKGPEPGPGGIDRMCAVRFSLLQWLKVDVEVEEEGREGGGRLMEARALERWEERNKNIYRYTKHVNKPKQAEQT